MDSIATHHEHNKQSENPIYQLATSRLNLLPIWDFDEATILKGFQSLCSLGGLESPSELASFLTVPGSPYYLPPMRPTGIKFQEWLAALQLLYARSAHSFIAEVYTSILNRRGAVGDKKIHMLWDDAIPRPTHATALFWLMHCETWPLLNSNVTQLLEAADSKILLLDNIFPHQPFVLPQSLHSQSLSLHANGYAKFVRESIGHYGLSYMFDKGLTRRDRDLFSKMNPDYQVIFRPKNMICMHSHAQTTDVRARQVNQVYGNNRFTSTSVSIVDAGHGLSQTMESNLVLDQIMRLRAKIMDKTSIIPGLPTHASNLYAAPGVMWRPYNETHLSVKIDPDFTPLTHDNSRIQLDDSIIDGTPCVMPRVWMGWSTPIDSINDPDVNQSMRKWALDYQVARSYAVRCLMHPELVLESFAAHVHAESVVRHQKLSRVGRIVKSKPEESPEQASLRDALKNTAFKFD